MQDDKNVVLTTTFINRPVCKRLCGLFHLLILLCSFSMWKRPQFLSGFSISEGLSAEITKSFSFCRLSRPFNEAKNNFLWSFTHIPKFLLRRLWSFSHCLELEKKALEHSHAENPYPFSDCRSIELNQLNSCTFSFSIMWKKPQFFSPMRFGPKPLLRDLFQGVNCILILLR